VAIVIVKIKLGPVFSLLFICP